MKQLPQKIDVSLLDLDPGNPRLPEYAQGASQSEILQYLYENDVLEELGNSYVANGYFESEPLIVLPADVTGRRIVAEGNRRLATLMLLHQLQPAVEAELTLDLAEDPTMERLRELTLIPAVEADDRDDVSAYLGFRHINGLKRWDADAKARWIYNQVETRVSDESDKGVFFDVGRAVGSNARGIRSSYIAYGLLRYARDELGLESALIDNAMRDRFGVWTRLLGTANVGPYIGLGRMGTTYEEVRRQIDGVSADRLNLVLSDLRPKSRTEPAVLNDSREVTNYSDVLGDERATEQMRTYGSLSLAIEIVRKGELADRIRSMTKTLEVITLDVRRYQVSYLEQAAVEELFGASRTLRAAISAALVEAEDD